MENVTRFDELKLNFVLPVALTIKKSMLKINPEGDLYQMSVPNMTTISAIVVKTTLEARYNLVYRQNFRLTVCM